MLGSFVIVFWLLFKSLSASQNWAPADANVDREEGKIS